MNRAMFAGVAGLKTHQTKMDVIGNNIANVNTYGYKSQRAVFADLMYQSIRGASAGSANKGGTNPSSVGYGSSLAGIQSQMTTSSMQSTGFGLDVAITGEGFLQVMDGDGNTFYTKAGMLDYDSQGYLTDINGNFVLGSATKDGKPGSEKIRLDNIGAVDPKKPLAEKEINGVKYKIEASNASKYGNVGITLGSSEDLPAGLKAKATISTTGAILVQLNAYESFSSMTDLNNAINAAITEANGGKQHAAGTFTISANPDNAFGTPGATGTFTGSGKTIAASLNGDAAFNTAFSGNLKIDSFSPGTGTSGNATFKVVAGTAPGTYNIEAKVGTQTFKKDGVTVPTSATIELTGDAGGKMVLKVPDGKTLQAGDLNTAVAAPANSLTATFTAAKYFLGGAKVTQVDPNFPDDGQMIFTPGAVSTTDGSYPLTIEVNGRTYTATQPAGNIQPGSTVKFETTNPLDGSITMTFPSKADMEKNMGMNVADSGFSTAFAATKTETDYTARAATSAMPLSLTGAQIAGAAGGVELGEITLDSGAKLFGGAMAFKKASSGFTGTGPVTPFNATFTPADPATGKKAFWTLDATIDGKHYKAEIAEDTAAGSVLLKASDTDYIEMSNPGFAAIKDYYKSMKGGAEPTVGSDVAVISGGAVTAKPSTKSNNLGLGDNFTLAGGTEGGAITLDELSSISIGSDGTVTVSHPDKGVVVAGKISLANFANAGGLQQMGNNYYAVSANSGEAKLCDPGSDGTGALKSSALEMSNVDLSGEFADMITTQRGFQANSRIITVSDTMLEELINLKR